MIVLKVGKYKNSNNSWNNLKNKTNVFIIQVSITADY